MKHAWLPIARALAIGASIKISCCTSDRTMIVSKGVKWLRAHCFRCGRTETYRRDNTIPLKELFTLSCEKTKKEMPTVFGELSADARRWLLSSGRHLLVYERRGVKYSPVDHRVYLPVKERFDGRVTGWQARKVLDTPGPKYISYGDAACHCAVWQWRDRRHGDPVVLTEDWLSAEKVSQFIPSIALLGTSLSDAAIASLLKEGAKDIIVWMDPDEAGQTAASKIILRLTRLGFYAYNLKSEKDPKKHTFQEIESYLEEYM